MRSNQKKIIAVFTAAMLAAGSFQVSFAQSSGSSKGGSVLAAAAAQQQSQTAVSQQSDSEEAGSQAAAETENEVVLNEAENADIENSAADSSQDRSGEAENQSKSGNYSLEDYTDNQIAVLYKDGSLDLISCSSKDELADTLDQLAQDQTVELYQPDFSYEDEAAKTVSTAITDDPDSSKQWALENDGSFSGYRFRVSAAENVDVNAQKAWKYYTPAREVVVALVDTGVQQNHSDLAGSFWVNEDEIAGNGKDDDGNGYIDDVNGWNFYSESNSVTTDLTDNHGTHCAGTITAASGNEIGLAGLADYDNVKLMSVKALGGKNSEGSTLSLSRAIKYAEANGASICSLSLGTTTNDPILYQTMKNSSMLFIVAAGNGGETATGGDLDKKPSYPAAYDLDNIITVANVQADGRLHSSSDYGKKSVDLAAPGTDIYSTATSNKYAYMTGTSMAVPFVAAASAMVYSANTSLTLADTKNIILQTVKSDSVLADKTVSGGILDCGAAVAYAVTGSTQNESGQEPDIDTGSSFSNQKETTSDNGNSSSGNYDFTGSPYEGGLRNGMNSLLDWQGWGIRFRFPDYMRNIMSIWMGNGGSFW